MLKCYWLIHRIDGKAGHLSLDWAAGTTWPECCLCLCQTQLLLQECWLYRGPYCLFLALLLFSLKSWIHVFLNTTWDEIKNTLGVIVLHTEIWCCSQGKIFVQFLSHKLRSLLLSWNTVFIWKNEWQTMVIQNWVSARHFFGNK